MKKKLLIGIILFVAIISIAVFCYVKFVSNNDDDKTSETISQVNDDNFIDIDLVKHSYNSLNLDKDFTFAGFQKYREGGSYKYYYYFNEDTTVEITVNNNKVTALGVSIACNGSEFDRAEYLDCIDKLLAKNWFNFNKKEKDNIRSSILDGDMSERINGIFVHTFTENSLFWTIFL